MQSTYRPLASKISRSPVITRDDKQLLVSSLMFTKLFYSAGTCPALDATTQNKNVAVVFHTFSRLELKRRLMEAAGPQIHLQRMLMTSH